MIEANRLTKVGQGWKGPETAGGVWEVRADLGGGRAATLHMIEVTTNDLRGDTIVLGFRDPRLFLDYLDLGDVIDLPENDAVGYARGNADNVLKDFKQQFADAEAITDDWRAAHGGQPAGTEFDERPVPGQWGPSSVIPAGNDFKDVNPFGLPADFTPDESWGPDPGPTPMQERVMRDFLADRPAGTTRILPMDAVTRLLDRPVFFNHAQAVGNPLGTLTEAERTMERWADGERPMTDAELEEWKERGKTWGTHPRHADAVADAMAGLCMSETQRREYERHRLEAAARQPTAEEVKAAIERGYAAREDVTFTARIMGAIAEGVGKRDGGGDVLEPRGMMVAPTFRVSFESFGPAPNPGPLSFPVWPPANPPEIDAAVRALAGRLVAPDLEVITHRRFGTIMVGRIELPERPAGTPDDAGYANMFQASWADEPPPVSFEAYRRLYMQERPPDDPPPFRPGDTVPVGEIALASRNGWVVRSINTWGNWPAGSMMEVVSCTRAKVKGAGDDGRQGQ